MRYKAKQIDLLEKKILVDSQYMYKLEYNNITLFTNGNAIEDEHHFTYAVKNKQYYFNFSKASTKYIKIYLIQGVPK
jgi:hypothetical protein